jgi:hypothetical protein
VEVHTLPANLPVTVSYNQSSALPVDAGSYAITATITDADYQNSTTGTLVINPAEATITLADLEQTFRGTSLTPTVKTSPAGLPVTLTYNESAASPVNAGVYQVTASVNDPNFKGSTTAPFVINKATAGIIFTGLQQSYTGTAITASISTLPAGLSFHVTYNNISSAPVNAGSYEVTAIVSGENYEGTATNILTISKAAQTITSDAISDKYFGEAAFTLNAEASSRLPVQYAVTKGSAIIANNVVNLTGAGQVTIEVTQPGNENYLAAAVERTFCVKPAKPLITTSESGAYITLTSSGEEGNEWLFNGEPIAGATNQVLRVTRAGTYTVSVTLNGCQNRSDEVVVTVPASPATAIQLYPNPAADKIAIDVTHMDGTGECVVTVYNIMGEKVAGKMLDRQPTGWQAEIGIGHLTPGRYIIQVTNGRQHHSKTFVKQ